MDFLSFDNVSFTYPPVDNQLETDENGQPIIPSPVFDYFSASLPGGFVSLIGPNASGKSTFLLLAGGRLNPQQGKVLLFGEDIVGVSEEKRNELASFIYQNMEFDQDEPVGELLETVYSAGYHDKSAEKDASLFDDVLSVFELKPVLNHKLTGISKGEIQRVLLAFSILYGSKSIFMDEPMFAMEDRQKHTAMQFIRDYSKNYEVPVYIAMHELDLSKKYAENVLLFYPDRSMDFGTPEEVLTNEALEKAYGVPAAMLRETESLTRNALKESSEAGLK